MNATHIIRVPKIISGIKYSNFLLMTKGFNLLSLTGKQAIILMMIKTILSLIKYKLIYEDILQ